jgi:hypothetical protein
LTTKTNAALGFRAHSGWAALVGISGPRDSPAVIDRRRIELADPKTPRPVQPYHAAEGLQPSEAEEIVNRYTAEARRLAGDALRAAVAQLRRSGYEVLSCGILLGSGRLGATLAETLASHLLIHTAEGELFRGAIIHAGELLRLPIVGVKEREIYARGAAELSLSGESLRCRMASMGKVLGPPWGEDQKLSALVAWLALRIQGAR